MHNISCFCDSMIHSTSRFEEFVKLNVQFHPNNFFSFINYVFDRMGLT